MGKRWQRYQTTIYPTQGQYSLNWEAVVGNGHEGDIALDDIKTTDGACKASGQFIVAFIVLL